MNANVPMTMRFACSSVYVGDGAGFVAVGVGGLCEAGSYPGGTGVCRSVNDTAHVGPVR